MKCGMVYDGLVGLDNGSGEIGGETAGELFNRGLVAHVQAARDMTGQESALREQLTELSDRYSRQRDKIVILDMEKQSQAGLSTVEQDSYKNLALELSDIESEMRRVRKQLLAAASDPGTEDCILLRDGRHVQITYQGREMLHLLGARLESSREKDFGQFNKEIDWLRDSFSQRARKARRVLKIISPRMKKHEEIYLRSAAIGLSGIQNKTPKELAREFRDNAAPHVLGFRSTNSLLAAEVLTIMENLKPGGKWNAGSLKELKKRLDSIKSTYGSSPKEIERAATVIFSSPPEAWPRLMALMDKVNAERSRTGLLAKAIIAMECMEEHHMSQVLSRYDYFLKVIENSANGNEGSNSDMTAAAAFLASSPMDPGELANRYSAVDMVMDDLFIDRMDSAAALISIMNPGIMETLDNVRLASAEIMKGKLSLSGMENFSLGLKMVLQAGAHVSGTLTSGSPTPEFTDFSANTLAMSSAVRGHGIPYLVFHRSLVHNRAIRHHRFHPVHSHYVYG